MLPFYLAASAGSSGGGGGDLFGLSPEQTGNITASDIAGGKLSQEGIASVYDNLQAQAQTDLLDRSGYPTPAVTKPIKPANLPQKINADTGTWWTFDQNTGKSVDTKIKATKAELAANSGGSTNWSTETFRTKNNEIHRGRFANGKLVTDLGRIGEVTPETERYRKGQRDLGEVETLIKEAGNNANSSDINYFNQFSNGEYVYMEVEEPGALWGTNKSVQRVKIPQGKTAANVFASAKARHISVADVIESLRANRKK